MKKILLLLIVVDICISISNHFKLKKVMSKQEQMDAILAEINDSTNAIAARLQALIDAGADNVTQASLDALQADADALKAIGTPPPAEG